MESKKGWSQIGKWLPGVIISLITLFALTRIVNWQDLTNAFKTADINFIVAVSFFCLSSLLVRGKAWQVILGKPVTWVQSFFGICEGYFLNNILPFRAGEIGRSIFVGKSSKLGPFHVLSTIVIERGFDMAMAAVLVIATLPFVIEMAWVKPVAIAAFCLVLVMLGLMFFTASNKIKVMQWLNRVFGTKPFIREKILPQVEKLVEGFGMLTRPSQFLWSLFWIAMTWVVWVGEYYFVILQILPGAPLWTGAFMAAILALGVAIPSAPAALGVFEASIVAALSILGIDSSVALAYAIILHVIQFVLTAIFGIWGMVRDGQSIGSVFTGLHLRKESINNLH